MEIKVNAKKAVIKARIYRADKGKWYNLGVISKSKYTIIDKIRRFMNV